MRRDLVAFVKKTILVGVGIALLPLFVVAAMIARYRKKPIDVGIGPEPLINNRYHKQALEKYQVKAETFVSEVYYITDQFDVRADRIKFLPIRYLRLVYLFLRAIFRYQCLYFYFNGGPLGFCPFIWRWEPFFYRLANVKTVVMPYGSDIQDFTRCPNTLFRHALSLDYPQSRDRRNRVAKQIDLWTTHGDHILSGCDWVDYLYFWHTLMLSHFAINTDNWSFAPILKEKKTFRILHAPNHRNIKGTNYFIQAVEELQKEGLDVELVILERVSNERIKEEMQKADLIADQLVIGWYAMFAIEGMAMGKPVICYLRDDLLRLYEIAGLIRPGEVPIHNANPENVKDVIRDLIHHPEKLKESGQLSKKFVADHHSLDSIGKVFYQINQKLKIGAS